MSSKKFWNMFAIMTLVVALAGTGISVYNYSQIQNAKMQIPSITAQMLSRLTKAVVQAPEGADAELILDADDGDDNEDTWTIRSTAGDNDLGILNHVSELMTIRDTGQVGINDANPADTLSVRGTAVFSNVVDSTTAYQFMDADGGTPVMNVDTTNERVGIGTAASGYPLEVAGAIVMTGGRVEAISGLDNVGIYRTNSDSGSYPFTTFGRLVLQSRSNSDKDIVFMTGISPRVRMVVGGSGNVGVGTTGPLNTLSISGTLAIGDDAVAQMAGDYGIVMSTATTTPTMPAGNAGFFVADTDGSAEMWVMGENDIPTQLSSHNRKYMSSTSPFPWTFTSRSDILGWETGANITDALHDLEQITGRTYITYTAIAKVDWDEREAEIATVINAQRLAEAAAVMVEVAKEDATELYTITTTIAMTPTQYITETVTTYELDTATGNSVEVSTIVTTTVTEEVETGTAWRLIAGCRLDADSGLFYCPVGKGGAVYDAYIPSEMPGWMADRVEP